MLLKSKVGLGLIVWYLIWCPGSLSARSSSAISQREAVLRSLLIPGCGQHALGAEKLARGFMVAEAGLWIGYYLASETAQWYHQNYRAFAALHAGTDYALKSDIYYFWLGQYDSIQEYNTEQIRRRDLDSIYPTDNGYDWSWDDTANRQRYNQLRQAGLLASKGASFLMGSMVLNRVVSAINILFLTRSGNEYSAGSPAFSATLVSIPQGGQVRLLLVF